jgi:2-methylaconitate cis-trans-isomerase PrpF
MSVLLVAAALAATASALITGLIVYILISFARSGRLLASRIGHPSFALVVVAQVDSRRQNLQQTSAALRDRRQLRHGFAH